MTVEDVVLAWRAKAAPLAVPEANTFLWSEGEGPPVVCLHGVPASSYLFRKVLPELASRGFRALAFDFPGLGFADRPEDFDYSWSSLARWTLSALNELGLERYHLLLHDIAVPIGFELARLAPNRVLSATALNSMIRVKSFRRSWPMKPFAVPVLGELWLGTMSNFTFETLFRRQGVQSDVPKEEILAYLRLLKEKDGGRAFLKIMRGFELTADYEDRILGHLKERKYPAQVAWGQWDPALTIDSKGEDVRLALGNDVIHRLEGKHYVPEDAPSEIASLVQALARTSREV